MAATDASKGSHPRETDRLSNRATLEIDSPSGRKRKIRLRDQKPITIGRDAKNVLAIKDERLSRFHCIIEKSGSSVRIRDLESRNGTRVNNRQVKQAELKTGDWLQVGRVKIQFLLEAGGTMGDKAHPAPGNTGSSKTKRLRDEPTASDEGIEIDWQPPEASASPGQTTASPPMRGLEAPVEDHEDLREIADSLTDKSFDESSIALINARGQTLHASSEPRKRNGDSVAAAVLMLRHLLLLCFRMRATDLHIEPQGNLYRVRVRVDGTMVAAPALTAAAGARLLRVVKILCDIDIARSNIVQEGHFSTQLPDRRVDYRVSFTPSMYGQKLVLRVLDVANAPQYITQMNVPDWIAQILNQVVRQDTGMVLSCGPTGSGKTTTLYALLREIDFALRNVTTIEDPVEFQIDGVTQLPINESTGNSFSTLLRSVLRQDPDVILVGEIRDPETAKIAMQAAMTGHLVFSTVHARDTVGTIFRLLNLGVEPYMVATGLNVILAQRLVRQLCPHCRQAMRVTDQEQTRMKQSGAPECETIYTARGCPNCLNTGFAGRRAIFELLHVNEHLSDVILANLQMQDIRDAVRSTDFTSLYQSGMRLVAEGTTSLDEIERVVGTD